MDKAKKKKIQRMIALVCVVAVVILLAAMPLIAKQDPEEDGPKASILSGTVSNGSIDTALLGGGTLAEDDAVTVSVPSAVKLKEFLVANGDAVTEGTAIATVDRVTVMTAITQVQETLEHLSEQIEEASEEISREDVTALSGGIVKILHAREGDSVQSVMLEHGALAVLSLDGLMAVDMVVESRLAVGTAVTVTLSDGTAATGKVIKNLAGEMTVTVDDNNYPVNDTVQVTAEDGTAVGSGALYIYSPWNATAYAGTVKSVNVSVGDNLNAGKKLMVLEDVGYTATYRQLIGQRQEYEELMLELFKMYQTETVTAPCDGVVSGIDKNSVQLLSGNGNGFVIRFLANAPNGDDEMLYSNYLGKVNAVASNGWLIAVDPQAVPVADYKLLADIPFDAETMTQLVLHTETDLPIFTLTEDNWTLVEKTAISDGDILLFAADDRGKLVWTVLLKQEEPQPDAPGGSTQPGGSTEPGGSTNPGGSTEPGGSTQSGGSTEPGGSTQPSGSTQPDNSGSSVTPSFPSGSGSSSFPSGGMTGGFPSGGMTQQEDVFELYGLEMSQVATVTPQDSMTLDITIDEKDITALTVGMTATVRIDALGGEKHTATIADIGNTGTNNGGSSKYTVTLVMERAENMLSGMNATASIVLETTSDVRTVPAAALVELGNSTVIYTRYDEKKEELLDPVVVKVGNSDGETAQILEGLESGQTYYYAYYDTLEISNTPDFGSGGGFMFR